MKLYLKSLFKLLFSNLHYQMKIIYLKQGPSALYRLLFIFAYLFIVGRILVLAFCLYFRLSAYFEVVDLQFKPLYDDIDHYQINTLNFLLLAYSTLFQARLFCLFYFSPDRVVWSHLYDLVVRNRAQTSLQLWQQTDSQVDRKNWLNRLKHFYPSLQSSGELQHYPSPKPKIRIKCFLVYSMLELVANISALNNLVSSFTASTEYAIGVTLTTAQLLFNVAFKVSHALVIYNMWTSYLLVALIIYVVCTVYTEQYRQVNQELDKLLIRNNKVLNGFQLSKSTIITISAYRTAHTRLTAFILRFNESIVSQIISYYLHYIVPLQAFTNVSLYFSRNKMSLGELLSELLFSYVFWLLLVFITFFTAKVNSKIVSSGPTVGKILARRRLMHQQKKRTRNSTWNQELFKLSTYYEQVWRSEKELAFTAGLNNATMNWQYISEFAFFYTSFVLYFAGMFNSEEFKEGFKA